MRAICVAGILHTTAAVIGGLGALVSVFTGLTAVLGGLGAGLLMDGELYSFDILWAAAGGG